MLDKVRRLRARLSGSHAVETDTKTSPSASHQFPPYSREPGHDEESDKPWKIEQQFSWQPEDFTAVLPEKTTANSTQRKLPDPESTVDQQLRDIIDKRNLPPLGPQASPPPPGQPEEGISIAPEKEREAREEADLIPYPNLEPQQSIIRSGNADSSKASHDCPYDDLCDRCAKFDLEEWLSMKLTSADTHVAPLGRPDELRDSHCKLCWFFYAQMSPSQRDKSQARNIFATENNEQRQGVGRGNMLKIGGKTAYVTDDVDYMSFIYKFDTEPFADHVRRWDAYLNYDLLRSWVRECQERHVYCKEKYKPNGAVQTLGSASQMITLDGMKLIDCRERRIVDPKPGYKYAALSYVWAHLLRFETESVVFGQLPRHLPQLIEDVITVTLQIGMRYLWIDRYCISEDGAEKHHQITNMDSIYSQAEVTLIMAFNDYSKGIPGVSSRRIPQPRVRIGGLELRSSPNNPRLHLRDSIWNRRGWTYQEALLSRRRITFTDQAVFTCPSTWLAESTPPKSTTLDGEKESSRSGTTWFPDIVEAIKCKDKIEAYTQREFTYQNDRLLGFLGVFKAFSRVKPPCYHIWGIPLFKRNMDGGGEFPPPSSFLGNMCWDVARPGQRLEGFPSWCWTGWVAPIRFNWPYDLVQGVHVSLMTRDGAVILWDEVPVFLAGGDDRQLSTRIQLSVWTFQAQFRVAKADKVGAPLKFCLKSHENVALHLNMELTESDALHARLSNSKWTCIVLGRWKVGTVQYAMVVDFDHGIAHRIGYLKFPDKEGTFREAKMEFLMD